jgi:hypothetical protein
MINLTPNTKSYIALFAAVVVVTIAICNSADYVMSISKGYLTVSGVM